MANSDATEVHAVGCAHRKGVSQVFPMSEVPSPDDPYADDFYHVAPCARKASK
jgi:hypothetical protein